MGPRFVLVDRDTPLLLPVDLREWVPQDSLARFLVDVLAELDFATAQVNVRGTGSAQYPPEMMLGVLIFCYAHGLFSSRQIERATYHHVEVRYLTGNTHPDHNTIAKFRRENAALLRTAFVQLLQYAQRLGVLRLGALALDGTKLKAAAQKQRTRTFQQLEEELAQLELKVDELLSQAAQADRTAEPPPALPPELVEAQARRAQLQAAKAEFQVLAQAQHDARQAERARLAAAQIPPRGLPEAGVPEPQPTDLVNLSDPQSALTPGKQEAFIQGYNAQLAVSVPAPGGVGLIVAADVVRDTSDQRQLEPMTRQAVANLCAAALKPVALPILADRGYDNTAHILTLERTQPVRIICPLAPATRRGAVATQSRYLWEQQRWAHRDARQARLAEPAEQALYAQRNTTVEPTFGILKEALGFTRFGLRGLAKVRAEWDLLALAFNCRRLRNARAAQTRLN